MRGAGNPHWRGGSWVEQGYRVVQTPNGPEREHRVVAAQMLGRPLRPQERVHHLNHDRLDNRPENLQVLSGQAEHMRLHQREHLTRGRPAWAWEQRGGGCADCGEATRPHYAHGVCGRCYQRRRRARSR